MLTLEEFYKNYVPKEGEVSEIIDEAKDDVFDINYNDGAVAKLFKRFFNWFLGSSEKAAWDPYNSNWNKDGTEEKLKELKQDGVKADIEIKEIGSYEEFKAGVNKAVEFLNIKKAFEEKGVVSKWKEHKFGCIQATVDGMIKDTVIVMFAYKYKKDIVSIDIIEGLEPYAGNILIKDLLNKIKAFLKKQMKRDKVDAKSYSIRIVKLSKYAGWSYPKLLEFMANNKSDFKRLEKEEADKELERIFVAKL